MRWYHLPTNATGALIWEKITGGVMADNYLSNPIYIEVMDKKYGVGAAKFIGTALKVYLERK